MSDELIARILALLASGRLGCSIDRTAEVIDSGRSMVYQVLNSGALVGRKFGDRTIIPVWEIIRFLDALPPYKSPSENLTRPFVDTGVGKARVHDHKDENTVNADLKERKSAKVAGRRVK
ncbi:MAG: hypothetical protein VW600_02500 [Ferrovibrio sp.]